MISDTAQPIPMPNAVFDGPRAWIGAELKHQPERWIKTLSGAEIAELEAAASHYLALGQDIGEINAAQFPLPSLSAYFKAMREKLLKGIGFEILRGLPTENYDRATACAIFCGIGAHLGSARSQNAKGHILGHVRDIGADPSDTKARIYQTSARQTFHTDSADLVGLLCLKKAREGGESLLVSVDTLYNRLAETVPDLLPLLFEPLATDRRGEVPEGMLPYMTIPPLSWHQGQLTVFYQRQYLDSAQRFPDALRLTDRHIAALDAFDAAANDPDLHLTMQLEPGDMQFVYNHSFLHDRTGFEDWPDLAQRRHLLRLWLSVPGDRELPDSFKQRYGSIEVGNRGGIITAGTQLHAPLD